MFPAANEARDIVFHHGFAALIFDPLAVAHDAAAARGHRFGVEHFDFDRDRIADFHRSEEPHLVEAGERQAGAVDEPGLHRESFGQAEERNELQNVVLGDRAPAGGVALAGFKLFEGFAVHITPFCLSSAMAPALRSSHEDSTCAECSPSKGGGKRTDAGVAENFTGKPAMRTLPAVGCGTSRSMLRCSTCGALNT